MGRLKNILKEDASNIATYLMQHGFAYSTYVCGRALGWQKVFPVDDGLYYTYVHCDLENGTLRLYKEYDCGGEVSSRMTGIPKCLIENDDPKGFIDWLDEETYGYL